MAPCNGLLKSTLQSVAVLQFHPTGRFISAQPAADSILSHETALNAGLLRQAPQLFLLPRFAPMARFVLVRKAESSIRLTRTEHSNRPWSTTPPLPPRRPSTRMAEFTS